MLPNVKIGVKIKFSREYIISWFTIKYNKSEILNDSVFNPVHQFFSAFQLFFWYWSMLFCWLVLYWLIIKTVLLQYYCVHRWLCLFFLCLQRFLLNLFLPLFFLLLSNFFSLGNQSLLSIFQRFRCGFFFFMLSFQFFFGLLNRFRNLVLFFYILDCIWVYLFLETCVGFTQGTFERRKFA